MSGFGPETVERACEKDERIALPRGPQSVHPCHDDPVISGAMLGFHVAFQDGEGIGEHWRAAHESPMEPGEPVGARRGRSPNECLVVAGQDVHPEPPGSPHA